MSPGTKFYRVAWFFYLALAVAGLLWVGAQRGRLGLELFFDPGGWWIDLGAGLALGSLLLAFWRGLLRFTFAARALEQELARLLAPLATSEAIALAVISALAEELFFRGALQSAWGYLPAALLFALLHTGPGRAFRIWTLFALVGGLSLGLLVLLRGPVGGAIVAHLLVNGVNLVRLARLPVPPAERSSEEPAEGPAGENPRDE